MQIINTIIHRDGVKHTYASIPARLIHSIVSSLKYIISHPWDLTTQASILDQRLTLVWTVWLDRVAKRLRSATDLHNILIAYPGGSTGISICTRPIQSSHSTEWSRPEGRARSHSTPFLFSTVRPAGTPQPPTERERERDPQWLQHWIARPVSSFVFMLSRCFSPVCRATRTQKKMSTQSTRTRWRCSTRRCPPHRTLSCFTPHGKWTVTKFIKTLTEVNRQWH